MASSGAPSPMEKPTPSLSLEALMSDSLLFEEPLPKDPDEEVVSALGGARAFEGCNPFQDGSLDKHFSFFFVDYLYLLFSSYYSNRCR